MSYSPNREYIDYQHKGTRLANENVDWKAKRILEDKYEVVKSSAASWFDSNGYEAAQDNSITWRSVPDYRMVYKGYFDFGIGASIGSSRSASTVVFVEREPTLKELWKD